MTPHRADVLVSGLAFPEGPMFDDAGGLWWSEILGGRVSRRDSDGTIMRLPVGGKPNGLALSAPGCVLICDGELNTVRSLDVSTGALDTVAGPFDAPNDLAFDAAGNLIFSCPGSSRTEPTGYVCCLAPDGSLSTIADGLYFPNGVALAADGATLFVAETYRQRVWAGRWDGVTRQWSERQARAETTPGFNGPDGLAMGADGTLYVAVFGSGCIDIFDADGGRIGAVPTPGRNPTNCAFDPSGRLGLVVTEAEHGEILSFPTLGHGPQPFRALGAAALAA